jgi:cell wall-associated NlpC family hydrolase
MNAYSYVKNNPINFADPTGESLAPTKSTSIKDLFSKNIPSYATRAPIISPIVLGPARPSTTLTPPTPESKLLTTSKASNTQSGNASTTKYNSTKVGEYNTNFANIVAQQVGKKYKQATDSVGPDVFDCSGIIVYAIRQTVNPNFPRINADTFYKKYTSPSASPDVGTVNFYDYEPVGDADRGTIDHMTTNIEGGMMIHPSSSAGIVQSKAQNYMDSYTNKKGGVIYSNRQLNWALIIGE